MNFRNPAVVVLVVAVAAVLFIPGRGMMTPAILLGEPRLVRIVPLALIIFCAVYFGTLKFWEMLTGDRLEKPFPAILALVLAVRLTVECARMLMWGW